MVLLFSILMAAVAPGVSLLTYIYLKDRYHSEPIAMVLKLFFLGAIVVFPIMIIQRGLLLWLGESPVVFSFIISSGVEEGLKWFVLYHIIYNHTEFDEPYDGIVYATAISLGFATFENVLYAFLVPSSFGGLLMRALLPVSGHALFGIMMGYYLGKAKFRPGPNTRKFIVLSFAMPFFWHGLYDWIMMTFMTHWFLIIVPLMAFLWIRGLRKIQRANNNSPFRLLKREDEIKF